MRKKYKEKSDFISFGRVQQKMKTRELLLAQANQYLISGQKPSLEAIAKSAGLSKATAYRYFPNVASLYREASLHIKSQSPKNLFDGVPEENLKERIAVLINYHFDLFVENEREFRLFLSSIMQDSVDNQSQYSRAGRRLLLIEEALRFKIAKMEPTVAKLLINSIGMILGIESFTILKDLSGLSPEEIKQTWQWSIDKLLGKALNNI